jgi:aerobic carbon-monoxide dehydrogenase medium subunit
VKRFELLEPNSLDEAFRLLSEYGDEAKIYAGGTALVKLMKKRLVHPSYLVNIKGLKGLHYIREDEEGLKIGALATLREIETSPLVRQRLKVVGEMVHTIGSVQIRNVGTLAGNLCFADPASDPAPVLIALGADLKIARPEGERILPVEEFFTDFYETALSQGEILEEIQIPFLPKGSGAVYLKHTMRVAFDLAVVGVAVRLDVNAEDGVCMNSKIVLGGVASTPVRVKKAEELLKGKIINDTLITKVAMAASAEVDPIQDVRASAEYRREMIEVFVERGIQKALERAKGGVL